MQNADRVASTALPSNSEPEEGDGRPYIPSAAALVEAKVLFPCPECFGAGGLQTLSNLPIPESGREPLKAHLKRRYRVACSECLLYSPWRKHLRQAVMSWNRAKGLYHRGRPPAARLDDDHGYGARRADGA